MHKCRIVVVGWIVAWGLFVQAGETARAENRGEPSFSVVVLPDTQFYSESYPETYVAQTKWIVRRVEPDRVEFVIHLGDLVQNAGVEQEWVRADRAHRLLDGAVPYSVLPGNHDMETVEKRLTRRTTLYNKYFGPARFERHPWYGSHAGEGNDSNFCFFEAAGMKFMVVSLEFSPDDETLRWANRVIASHPDRRVILATHCYMRPDGRDQKSGEYHGLVGNSGEDIWDKLVRKQPNVFMVLSGHVLGVGRQTSTNDAGRPVHEILADYQGLPEGGSGWLKILRFVPGENRIEVEAYSPLLDQYNEEPEHTYTLDYEMTGTPLKKAG